MMLAETLSHIFSYLSLKVGVIEVFFLEIFFELVEMKQTVAVHLM
jgi:hypothetical protein